MIRDSVTEWELLDNGRIIDNHYGDRGFSTLTEAKEEAYYRIKTEEEIMKKNPPQKN